MCLLASQKKTLGAQQLAVHPRAVDEAEKALRMKRSACSIGCRGDAVFLGFWHVFATQFL